MTQFIDWPPFLELETSTLIAETYQRPTNDLRVKRMVRGFKPELFGAITAAVISPTEEEGSGSYAVIDGQHRWRVALELRLDTVWVQLHEGLSYKERARMFVELQRQRKNLTAVERFKAEVEAGDIRAMEIAALVYQNGLVITGSPERRDGIRAVVGMEKLYNRSPLALEKMLRTITLWSDISKNRTSTYIVRGVGRFFVKYPNVTPEEVFKKLDEHDLMPQRILDRAQQRVQVGGSDAGTAAVAEVIEEVWRG